MQINIVYDASVSRAPAGFTATVAQAVQFLDQTFTDAITIAIAVGWGEVGSDRLPFDVTGEGDPLADQLYSYGQVKAALASHITSPADATAVADLPAADPTGGGEIDLGGAEQKVLGLGNGGGSGLDGEVGFRGDVGVGTVEHELTHAMGRIAFLGQSGAFSVLDLFRYTAPGALNPAALNGAYLSADGGQTAINSFDATSDPADWSGAAPDAFDAYGGPNDPFTPGDVETMNLLGFASAGSSPPVAGTTLENVATPPLPYAVTDPLLTNASGSLVLGEIAQGQAAFATVGGLGPEWQFEGAGFLRGDGRPGFLIRNTGTVESGALYVGEVSGSQATYTHIGGVGPEWQFEGNADFLGAGQSQFLIRNAGTVEPGAIDIGEVVNGASGPSLTFTAVGGLGPEWQFEGNGDLLGDGRQGFLIHNTGSVEPGALYVGEAINGAAAYTPIGGVGPEWQFEGIGDFLGDGHTGFLIWNHGPVEPGALAVGEMVNGKLTFTDIGGVGPEWEFAAAGNYAGGSQTDILIRNTGTVEPGALFVGQVTGGALSFTKSGTVGLDWNFHDTNVATRA